ncbi:PAS domain-containing protein [Caballeronia sp. dw_19]|uniref:helix-turn-helix transcriptional regulator n=1 Tax=unclassified Caballeronia TaxID=2646786 RepID=UPI001BD52DB2|nr:PAS domain-containing protein [Caballeronia sp. dw_19]
MKQKLTDLMMSEKTITTGDEEQKLLEILASVLDGLSSVISANTELILHDMRNPAHSTFAIVNGHVTGRQVGDPIIAAPVDDKGFDLLLNTRPPSKGITTSVGRYRSRTKDGRELLSMTVLLRNKKGAPFASVCANTDLTDYQLLHASLGRLLARQTEPEPKEPGHRPTIDELIEDIVSGAIQRAGVPVALMDKSEKLKVVSELTKRGVFMIKGAVERVAQSLSVTRFTVYNYLEELGQPRGDSLDSTTAPVRSKRPALKRPTKKRGVTLP